MIECTHCGVVYEVVPDLDYSDAEERYCPYCGEEPTAELDFE